MIRHSIRRAMTGATLALALSGLLAASSVQAQTSSGGMGSDNTSTGTRDDRGGFDAGWLGLLGLFGLLGMRRKEEGYRRTEARGAHA